MGRPSETSPPVDLRPVGVLDEVFAREGSATLRRRHDSPRAVAVRAAARRRPWLLAALVGIAVATVAVILIDPPWVHAALGGLLVAFALALPGVRSTADLGAPPADTDAELAGSPMLDVTGTGLVLRWDRTPVEVPWVAVTSVDLDERTDPSVPTLDVDPAWVREQLAGPGATAVWRMVRRDPEPRRPLLDRRRRPAPYRKPEGVVRLPADLDVEPTALAAWLDVRRRLARADRADD